MQVMPQSQITTAIVEDNIKITEKLQHLFELNSYKIDIPSLPEEHALAAMNLANNVRKSTYSFTSN
jgi:hypothetical protein